MRRAFLFVFLLAPGFFLAAQTTDRNTRWRQDLQYLSIELPRRHANLFFQLKREDFDRAVNDLNQAIPVLADHEVIVGLARIVAMAGDAHTSLGLFQRAAGFRSFPLTVTWMEEGLFVVQADPAYARALGARVVKIGDTDVEQAYQAVGTVISHENDPWLRALSPDYLVIPEILQAIRVLASIESAPYTFEDSRGNRFTLNLIPQASRNSTTWLKAPDPARGFIPLHERNRNLNYWFQYLENSRTFYFAYNQAVEMSSLPFSTFVQQMFDAVNANISGIDRFVVDLRHNTGGNSALLDPFFQALEQLAPRYQEFPLARLFVITGRETFSTGMLHACDFYKQSSSGPITLVGEPTGGDPVGYGDIQVLTLPNSGLQVSYSTKFFQLCAPPYVVPHINIPLTAADRFSRHDPFLAAVLAYPPLTTGPAAASQVVNGASFQSRTPVTTSSLASVFGNFAGAPSADAGSLPLPREMGGLQVLVNSGPAPLLAVRPTQVNFQVPRSIPSGQASVRVVLAGKELLAGTMTVGDSGPGLFSVDLRSFNRAGAVLNQDFRLNSETAPARRGEAIQIFATGAGALTPLVEDGAAAPREPLARTVSAPSVFVGLEPATVLFSGLAPGFAGLWQINVRLPDRNLSAGQYPLFVGANGAFSNAVTIWVSE